MNHTPNEFKHVYRFLQSIHRDNRLPRDVRNRAWHAMHDMNGGMAQIYETIDRIRMDAMAARPDGVIDWLPDDFTYDDDEALGG